MSNRYFNAKVKRRRNVNTKLDLILFEKPNFRSHQRTKNDMHQRENMASFHILAMNQTLLSRIGHISYVFQWCKAGRTLNGFPFKLFPDYDKYRRAFTLRSHSDTFLCHIEFDASPKFGALLRFWWCDSQWCVYLCDFSKIISQRMRLSIV